MHSKKLLYLERLNQSGGFFNVYLRNIYEIFTKKLATRNNKLKNKGHISKKKKKINRVPSNSFHPNRKFLSRFFTEFPVQESEFSSFFFQSTFEKSKSTRRGVHTLPMTR